MRLKSIFFTALFIGTSLVSAYTHASEARLSADQISLIYKNFVRVLQFDVKHHNLMVKFREENRDRLLNRVGKSFNISGYPGDDLTEAFAFAAAKQTKIYTHPTNYDEYEFTVRIPDSLIRQCKPYGEDLFDRYGLAADLYVKFMYNGTKLYENSMKSGMSYHYNCTMNATDRDMERILVDSLIPVRETSVPYWMGEFQVEDFEDHNKFLWNAVERAVLTTSGIFNTTSRDEQQQLLSGATSGLRITILPTRESFTAALKSLVFQEADLKRG